MSGAMFSRLVALPASPVNCQTNYTTSSPPTTQTKKPAMPPPLSTRRVRRSRMEMPVVAENRLMAGWKLISVPLWIEVTLGSHLLHPSRHFLSLALHLLIERLLLKLRPDQRIVVQIAFPCEVFAEQIQVGASRRSRGIARKWFSRSSGRPIVESCEVGWGPPGLRPARDVVAHRRRPYLAERRRTDARGADALLYE